MAQRLIAQSDALGKPEIAVLLQANLEQQRRTLDEVLQATRQLADRVA
jgi:flagellin-specific chaperone FliS